MVKRKKRSEPPRGVGAEELREVPAVPAEEGVVLLAVAQHLATTTTTMMTIAVTTRVHLEVVAVVEGHAAQQGVPLLGEVEAGAEQNLEHRGNGQIRSTVSMPWSARAQLMRLTPRRCRRPDMRMRLRRRPTYRRTSIAKRRPIILHLSETARPAMRFLCESDRMIGAVRTLMEQQEWADEESAGTNAGARPGPSRARAAPVSRDVDPDPPAPKRSRMAVSAFTWGLYRR